MKWNVRSGRIPLSIGCKLSDQLRNVLLHELHHSFKVRGAKLEICARPLRMTAHPGDSIREFGVGELLPHQEDKVRSHDKLEWREIIRKGFAELRVLRDATEDIHGLKDSGLRPGCVTSGQSKEYLEAGRGGFYFPRGAMLREVNNLSKCLEVLSTSRAPRKVALKAFCGVYPVAKLTDEVRPDSINGREAV